MHPILVRLGVFSPFLRKKVENAPIFCTFGCFRIIFKKLFSNRPTDRPNYSEITLEGNTAIFLFWPNAK